MRARAEWTTFGKLCFLIRTELLYTDSEQAFTRPPKTKPVKMPGLLGKALLGTSWQRH